MLSQRLVIQLLPLEILFIGGFLFGWAVYQMPVKADLNLSPQIGVQTAARGSLSPIFTPEVQRWAKDILDWSEAYQLDPNLVATVMQIESCGWPGAVSSSGAQGLFQVMPFHFAPEEAMQDPNTNAQRGLAYLALGLARAGGDAVKALAGYNGGHSQIGRAPTLWPAQTKRYAYWGAGIYADAVNGKTSSPRLQEWLQSGGASLCTRAAQSLGMQ
jgi:soluble lytic murein transglycosylase-like protein